jgi:hypothetical protein
MDASGPVLVVKGLNCGLTRKTKILLVWEFRWRLAFGYDGHVSLRHPE